MATLTAAEIQVLAALEGNNPMTVGQLRGAVSSAGMHLDPSEVAAAVRRLVDDGMAELTPAASLGKYRVTARGRAWIHGESPIPGQGDRLIVRFRQRHPQRRPRYRLRQG